ncbi:MAG TPA: hypothetical protein VEQ60_13695 [Longimicrobium sp.]|nr:hypothetical protein [Longimicrobium sp.]
MTRRAFIPLLAAAVATGCGGGDSTYPQYGPPAEYGYTASSHDPQADLYRAMARRQMDAEYEAQMRELREEQREWERQKNEDWARSFENPYD